MILPRELVVYILKIKSFTAWVRRKEMMWERLERIQINVWETIHFGPALILLNVFSSPFVEVIVEQPNDYTMNVKVVLQIYAQCDENFVYDRPYSRKHIHLPTVSINIPSWPRFGVNT